MTTIRDRLFKIPKLKEFAGNHVSTITINRLGEKHLEVHWTFISDKVTFDVDLVRYQRGTNDIWDELHWTECEMVRIEIQKQIKIWCDKVGIVDQSHKKRW